MTYTWHKITSLPAGGVISGISSGAGGLWLGSPAGLFSEKNGRFTHHLRGIPFSGASAVLALDKTVLAAGYPDLILRSADGGRTWLTCWVEQIASPVTCFAASPNLHLDAVILAGTDGDGILRSTDGGNSWQLSNFGLRSFNILDIACAPVWERLPASNAVVYNYEIVFAAAEEGVYQSPNAGRAWRFAGEGLPPVSVLSIAVSPDFRQVPGRFSTISGWRSSFSGSVFAGTDGAGLYRSQDGGKSWQTVPSLSTGNLSWSQLTINALYFDSQGTLFVGTGEQGILASPDMGETWRSLLKFDNSILSLAGHGAQLFAGAAGHGLLVSNDGGHSWQVAAHLSASHVTQLASIPSTQSMSRKRSSHSHSVAAGLLVGGITEGLWANTRNEWRRVGEPDSPAWQVDQPPIALCAAQDRFLALTPNRLLAALDPEQAWETLLESPVQFTALACAGEEIILGSPSGEVWHSPDAGKTWAVIPPAFRNARILALHITRSGPQPSAIYAAVRKDNEGMLSLWHAGGPGADWRLLLQERTSWQTAILAQFDPPAGEISGADILVAAGTDIFVPEQNSWRRQPVATPDAPVMALLSLPELNSILLAKPGELMLSRDRGATWEEAGLSGVTITALSRPPGEARRVLALSSAGAIYSFEF